MAFFRKAGSILQQTINRQQINHEISASGPSVFQILRFMSSSKVFVGGISWNTNDSSLQETFSKYGQVLEARIITDRETGRSRGFGFVTFGSPEEAGAAIQALDGKVLDGRTIRVNEANERPPRFGGGGGYGGGGFGGGGYGGGQGGYGGGQGGYGGGQGGYGGGQGGYGGGNYGAQGGEGGGYGDSFGTGNSFGNSGGVSYGSDNQSYGVAGGNDNFAGGNAFASNGFEGNTGSGTNQYGENDNTDNTGADDSQFPEGGNYRDDDDQPDDYAKRA